MNFTVNFTSYKYEMITFVEDITHGGARQFKLVGRRVAEPSFEPKFVCVQVKMTEYRDTWVVHIVVDLYNGKILPYDFDINLFACTLDALSTPHRMHAYTYCKLDEILDFVRLAL